MDFLPYDPIAETYVHSVVSDCSCWSDMGPKLLAGDEAFLVIIRTETFRQRLILCFSAVGFGIFQGVAPLPTVFIVANIESTSISTSEVNSISIRCKAAAVCKKYVLAF